MPLNLKGPRKTVERLTMVDSCIVYPSADNQQKTKVWDEELGDYADGPDPVPLYVGKCSMSPKRLQAQQVNMGGATQTELEYLFSVPVALPLFEDEAIVVMTAVHKGGDASLVNKQFTISDPNIGTYVVTRAYQAKRYIIQTA